jgi:hypothetical protein
MLAFLVRRIVGAMLVCIGISFIIFLIFIVVPGAGSSGPRSASPAERNAPERAEHPAPVGLRPAAAVWLFLGILVGVISAVTRPGGCRIA